MSDTVSITFTATVTHLFANEDSNTLICKIEDGSKYGGKANVLCTGPAYNTSVTKDSKVRITADRMPYGKVRDYVYQGEAKKAVNICYSAQKCELLSGGAEFTPDLEDSAIPF